MATSRSSDGDPARTLELLWRHRPGVRPSARRGPRQGLSVDRVVEAAISLADREGLDAVSMRRLAEILGVAPMTLYTYLPGKAELIDLMLDWVYAQMTLTDTAGLPWRARLEAIADDNRALFAAHPWAAFVSTGRPPLGPGLMAKYEHELQALEGTPLDDVERDAALTFLLDFVQTAARAEADRRAAARESEMDDAEWWAANAPLLARVVDTTAYPTAARVGTAAGAAHGAAYSPEHAYRFGLRRVLDGLGVLTDSREKSSCPHHLP
ncbi:MAG: TetR/AcrR family transcriptional regulator [Streptomycetales bacterium]